MSRKPTVTEQGDETFLSRWSRRKLSDPRENAREDLDEAAASGEREEGAQHEGDAEGGAAPERVLTDADMPDLESLDEGASYADFLSPGVSEALRRKALRKMFHAASYNVCDGLDDYAEDYTTFEKLGDIVTADMRHRMEMEAEKLRERKLAELDAAGDIGETEETVDDEVAARRDEGEDPAEQMAKSDAGGDDDDESTRSEG